MIEEKEQIFFMGKNIEDLTRKELIDALRTSLEYNKTIEDNGKRQNRFISQLMNDCISLKYDRT